MSKIIPPLFCGEVLVPPHVKADLVQSTTAILKRFVAWDENTRQFVARPDQPDLCILPLRSGPIAAAGLIAFAQKHDLPIPPSLPVDGIGREAYGAYERAHSHYARLWREQPEEFARLRDLDVETYGQERSFLAWIESVTQAAEEEDFAFGMIYFDFCGDDFYGLEDEIGGGLLRFLAAQTSAAAPPNAAKAALASICAHPVVTAAIEIKGKAHLLLIDDVTASQETNRLYANNVLQRAAGAGITFTSNESMFFFSHRSSNWLTDIQKCSLAGFKPTPGEAALVYRLLKGSAAAPRPPIGVIPFENLAFDTAEKIEAYAHYLDTVDDLIGQLQEHAGLPSREELLAQLLNLAANLRKAFVAAVDEAEATILDELRQPA